MILCSMWNITDQWLAVTVIVHPGRFGRIRNQKGWQVRMYLIFQFFKPIYLFTTVTETSFVQTTTQNVSRQTRWRKLYVVTEEKESLDLALLIRVHSVGSIVGCQYSFYQKLNFQAAAKINLNRFSNN